MKWPTPLNSSVLSMSRHSSLCFSYVRTHNVRLLYINVSCSPPVVVKCATAALVRAVCRAFASLVICAVQSLLRMTEPHAHHPVSAYVGAQRLRRWQAHASGLPMED